MAQRGSISHRVLFTVNRSLIADGNMTTSFARQLMYHCEAGVATGLSATVYGRAMYPEAMAQRTRARNWNAI